MERYLCIDIGDRRIGVAVSDPFNTYALPVKTYFRKNLKTDLSAILNLATEKCATAIVCGRPVNIDGTESAQTKKADFFIEKLRELFKAPIHLVDERLTTVEAEEFLISQGKSRKERKQVIDALAACNILNRFLNEIKFKEKNMKDNEKKVCSCGQEECDCNEKNCSCEEQNCDCDCEYGEDVVELTTDDGKKLKFFYVGTVDFEDKSYCAFEPAEEIDGLSEDDMVIFELKEGENGEDELLPIEDDALLDKVYEEFVSAMEEEEEN